MECLLMLNSLDYWQFHDEFTVVQAALLILDLSPSELQDYVLTNTTKPHNFDAVFSGITKAITNNKLKANIRYPISWLEDENNSSWVQYPNYDEVVGYCVDARLSQNALEVHFKSTPDWQNTLIELDDLKAWLSSRNIRPSFFFPEKISEPDYLNKDHPRYSDQLAACVKVWIAFEDENLLGAKSPKNAMEEWLNSRYSELGLVHQGKISKKAIEECAKVVNWKDKGGATATPTSQPTPP